MANKGPSARELKRQIRQIGAQRAQELRLAQGPATGRSASALFLGGNSAGFGLDEMLSSHIISAAPSGKSPMQQQQQQQHQQQQPQGLSATAAPQTLPLFGGELETTFLPPNPVKEPSLVQNFQNALHPEQSYQFEDVEMVPNFGDAFAVAPQAAQATMTNLGSGNYPLPASIMSPHLGIEPSPSVQMSPIQQPYPQNILGDAIGAPEPSFPMSQWANNPSMQQPESLLSTGPAYNPNFQPQSQSSNGYNPNFKSIQSQSSNGYNPNIQSQSQSSNCYNPNFQSQSQSSINGLGYDPNFQQQSQSSNGLGYNPNFQQQSQSSNGLVYNPNFQQQSQSSNGLGYNPNFQPQSQLSTGLGYNPNLQQSSTGMGECREMIQSPGLSGLYQGGWPSNYQNQFPIQQELLVMQPPVPNQQHEMVDPSSSRNVMMAATLQHNKQQPASFQRGSFPNVAAQGFGNLQAPRFAPTSIYDLAFEQLGLPIDPHLRLFRRRNL